MSVSDRTNIICFVAVITLSILCILLAKKMKLPCWKFQIGWILIMDVLGIALLINQLKLL